MECRAALEANLRRRAGHAAAASTGALDVLAQHVLGMACAAPFDADELYARGHHRRALCRPRPRDLRPRRRFRRDRRLCAEEPMSATPRSARPRTGSGASRHPRVAQQYRLNVGTIIEAPVLNVRYVRSAARGGSARAGRCSARSRSISRDAGPRRHLPLRRQGAALRGHPRERVLSSPTRPASDAKVPYLCRRQVPALDLSRRPGPRHAGRSRSAGRRCRIRSPTGCACRRSSVLPQARRPSGRDLPARRALLHGRLSVRGPARAPDARHAADPAAGARRRAAARLRRHRLFARRLGARRHGRDVRRASRRSATCSTRTCSATISRPGWPRAGC